MSTIIGIDPSINSTGICVKSDKGIKYYLITSKSTKKMKEFKNPHIVLFNYEKISTKDMDYAEKEYYKSNNIYKICDLVDKIISINRPEKIYMEGISYGSVSGASLADLSGLNFALRNIFIANKIPFEIISPTSVKKFATANGNAEKELMIDAWRRLDNNIRNITEIKIDDLADSYFIAHYSRDDQET
jgi:Holliday junction resolvasome RuvABC endonuclease subunit